MIWVLDVNIVFSALIRDSITRKIIFTTEQDFCFPEPSLYKIRKYKALLLEKSGLSEEEFLLLLNTLFRFIRLIPTEEIKQHWSRAKEIMEHVDSEDVTFIAAALSQENAFIWSDDRHFEEQEVIPILKTEEMVHLFCEE